MLRRAQEQREAQVRARQEYNKSLADQRNEIGYRKQTTKQSEREEAQASTGFEFECYTRDKMMKEERKQIKNFQEGQKDLEQWKKNTEKAEARKPVANVARPEEVVQRAQEIQKSKVDNRSGYN